MICLQLEPSVLPKDARTSYTLRRRLKACDMWSISFVLNLFPCCRRQPETRAASRSLSALVLLLFVSPWHQCLAGLEQSGTIQEGDSVEESLFCLLKSNLLAFLPNKNCTFLHQTCQRLEEHGSVWQKRT